MIELKGDQLIVRFPEVHGDAEMRIDFQRTLRIPDDDREYPLPAGLGRFPLRHVDDFAVRVPTPWIEHGGVMLPMYQSEALWLRFSGSYPFALKIAAGKINAVTGKSWANGLGRGPQDYVVVPNQPWIDGYCVEQGLIRQFVAMPLGSGYSAEEQLTGEAEHGGLQIVAYPMKREAYERHFRTRERIVLSKSFSFVGEGMVRLGAADMGLAPGGRMRQEIYDDPFDFADWDADHASRCFVHIANSLVWRAITDEAPPTVPPTAREYARQGIPWFEYYADGEAALEGSGILATLKSVVGMAQAKGDAPVPDNESVSPEKVIALRRGLKKGQVREGAF
jgi:hypothetical protein